VLWTTLLSFTSTRLLPRYDLVGLRNYQALLADPRFALSFRNLLLFGVVFGAITLVAGFLLAAGLHAASAAARPVLRVVFLAPLSISWLLTGLVWQWILNPGLGLEAALHRLGWTTVHIDWIVREQTALYMVAVAGAWHFAGLIMVLFLAGLRGIDPDIWKMLRLERIPPWRAYAQVALPMLRPYVLTAVLLLAFAVAHTFDLVIAMTGGGPGFATDLPTLLIYDALFPRSQAGVAAACAVVLMAAVVVAVLPYVLLELGRNRR